MLQILTPNKALNKAYLKEKVSRNDIETFKTNFKTLLSKIKEGESEEHHKYPVVEFLNDTWYKDNNYINTKGRTDFVIHNGKTATDSVGVILEFKSPTNPSEMITADKPNKKAMQELVFYYLRERIEHNNIHIKHLIITNINEWYIFDEVWFEKNVYQNSKFKKGYEAYIQGGKNTRFFYDSVASPELDAIDATLSCAYVNLRQYEKYVRNDDSTDDKKLIPLYKILSPTHLLKQSFANDSNSLDTKFYTELLHIIGLEEVKDGSKKLIRRKATPDSASLLESAIIKLEDKESLRNISSLSSFGATRSDQLFGVALELCITWVNRILFIKLLEGQLVTYNKGNQEYKFLNANYIHDYDELNDLFFSVLAERPATRRPHVKDKFARVPYLNSSLFDRTTLEREAIEVDVLDNRALLPLLSSTVLKNEQGKRKTGQLTTLQYLFQFLDAYDFSSDGGEEIQEENKNLINASVLGLIFEKINGYKDGSFFTPGFITMYMCRETIRRAVLQKFKEEKNWECETLDQLYDKIRDKTEANNIINTLRICDPAVGSGHFLVSALNEIIAIKSELQILQDRQHKTLRDYNVEVVNDELVVTDEEGNLLDYNPRSKESQRIQEALFHEKETIIENCLFGVDINPNSVKICRLRLWIELLKNTYYTADSNFIELETLPNIDINIKCGNSLISRFALDADLGQALKKSKWSIDSYRIAVQTYRNAETKEEKRQMEQLIEDIKGNFRTEIGNNDPKIKKLQKLNTEYYQKYQADTLFAAKLTKEQKKHKEFLEKEIEKIDTSIKEIKSNKIYDNAFEWRFEFPEVLDNEGKYVGFDIVIGNPPYVDLKGHNPLLIKHYFQYFETTENRVNLYSIFIELSYKLLSNTGIFSFINPNSILMNSSYLKIRKLISPHVFEIVKLPDNVFSASGVIVETIILLFQKGQNFKNLNTIRYKHDDNINYIEKNLTEYQSKEIWDSLGEIRFNIYLSNSIQKVVIKSYDRSVLLGEIADITLGITPYDKYKGHSESLIRNREFHSKEKINIDYKPIITGENINRFYINPSPKEYLKYGEWLGAQRDIRFFKEPRIIIRQIISGKPPRIYAGYTEEELYFTQIGFGIISKEIKPKCLVAILNSSLINFIHKFLFLDIEKELFQKILIENCKKLPIVLPVGDEQKKLEGYSDRIISAKKNDFNVDTSDLENELDQIVYQLYGLTEEEIKIIENN